MGYEHGEEEGRENRCERSKWEGTRGEVQIKKQWIMRSADWGDGGVRAETFARGQE